MIISDLNYVETVDTKVEGGWLLLAASNSYSSAIFGKAKAKTDNTALPFFAGSDSKAYAKGFGVQASAGGFAFSAY
jgi:hypothetical protein